MTRFGKDDGYAVVKGLHRLIGLRGQNSEGLPMFPRRVTFERRPLSQHVHGQD